MSQGTQNRFIFIQADAFKNSNDDKLIVITKVTKV